MRELLLSAGTNHTLLNVRNAVFVDAGFAVLSAKSGAIALDAIRSRHISAVTVGHSLSRALKERITGAAKERQLPVIVLHAHDYEAPISGADANLCGIDGASTILHVLKELLGEDSKGRVRPQQEHNPAQQAPCTQAHCRKQRRDTQRRQHATPWDESVWLGTLNTPRGAEELLERAFADAYGISLDHLLHYDDLTIEIYKITVRTIIPEGVQIAIATRSHQIGKETPGRNSYRMSLKPITSGSLETAIAAPVRLQPFSVSS